MGIMHKNTTSGTGLTNPPGSGETAVYTTPVLQTGQGDGTVGISGTIYLLVGASGTSVTLKLRQGNNTISGPLVQALPAVTVVAGNAVAISFGFTDLANWLEQAGGGQYTLTATVAAATGASTVSALDIEVIV